MQATGYDTILEFGLRLDEMHRKKNICTIVKHRQESWKSRTSQNEKIQNPEQKVGPSHLALLKLNFLISMYYIKFLQFQL